MKALLSHDSILTAIMVNSMHFMHFNIYIPNLEGEDFRLIFRRTYLLIAMISITAKQAQRNKRFWGRFEPQAFNF